MCVDVTQKPVETAVLFSIRLNPSGQAGLLQKQN